MAGALALAGCTGSGADGRDADRGGAAGVESSLGRVPIPTAPTDDPTASAAPHHPALVEMGAPVRAAVDGGSAVVTALGPEERTPGPGHARTVGVITLEVRSATRPLRLSATEFSSRDETGKAVPLRADGPAGVTAAPGRTVRLTVQGSYGSGAAQITWRRRGGVLAVWAFNVELD